LGIHCRTKYISVIGTQKAAEILKVARNTSSGEVCVIPKRMKAITPKLARNRTFRTNAPEKFVCQPTTPPNATRRPKRKREEGDRPSTRISFLWTEPSSHLQL